MYFAGVAAGGDGQPAVRARASGPPAQAGQLGRDVAAELLRRGAAGYINISAVDINGDDA